MKKTRKILSIVLAVLFAFSSMPVVYTGTAAADAVTYAAGDEGTLDNPTRPVEASGVLEIKDLYKLNINSQSTSYTFYQTKDNEYFTYGQTQGLQHYYELTSVSDRTLTFESIGFYKGESGLTNPVLDSDKNIYVNDPDNSVGENVVITSNPTDKFISKYYVTSQWKPTNSNATEMGSEPKDFVLQGAWTDVGGCKVYTWQNDVIFHGHSEGEKGEINTGYYEQLLWNWVNSDATQSAKFDLRIGTTIRVLDARELAKEIAEAEDILDNPEKYTQAYLSSVEATLNTIPDDLRDFSTVYDQSEIDRYAQMLKDVSRNSADYTEFNQLYKNLKSINNSKGAYTEESFNIFKAEIAQINANLPKNLDKTKQAVVDDATQALRDAFNKLVATDVSETLTPSTHTATGASADARTSFSVDNSAFHLMQTKDDQVFQIKQQWTIKRNDDTELGEQEPDFIGMTLDTTNPLTSHSDCLSGGTATLAPNNTSTFITHCVSCVESSQFTCWNQVSDSKGTNWISNGKFNSGIGIVKNSTTVLEVSPTFKGLAKGETAEGGLSLNFLQKFEYTYDIGYWPSKTTYTKHFHVNSTVKITDVRQLISAVADAEQTIANPGTHSENYITALQAAVDSVPVEMLRGVEYYTQAEVDKFYNDITTIPEDVADYSKFVETFEWMLAENKEKYTEDSYNIFIDEIYAINQNLPKNLTADKQATIDEAVEALYAAHDKLVSSHLNNDNVFTQDDISDTGNNPLAFSVSSTQYNFMQVADGQKFAIRTELTARNTKARYNCNLLSLRFSSVEADTVASICEARATPDKGCHNGEAVTLNQTDVVIENVSGVNVYAEANDAGDIGEHTTWVNTSGIALSTNGVLNDPTALSTSDSSAYAEMYYTGPTGNHEAYTGTVDVTFAFRLGWSYYEEVLGIDGETIRRHAHIPVNIKITDARALNALYEQSDAILNGRTDKNYTFSSLLNLYDAFNKVDADMAYGSEYYTQDEVNAAYAELKDAYTQLEEGADYSEYFKAYVKAEEIIKTNNKDSKGNSLYNDTAYQEFVEIVEGIDTNLEKNLSSDKQDIVDSATAELKQAVENLEANKYADYSRLNDAMTEAEKILAEEEANPGTYTKETIDAIQEAYNNALQNAFNNDPEASHKELSASEQATVDAAASALEATIADKEYKADYSEYEDAKEKADSITNNDGTYTDSAYQEYLDKIADIDSKLEKDLPDIAENRDTISDSTQAIQDAMTELENNKKADYTEFDKVVEELENIVNNPDVYTEETVKNAEDALDKANQNENLTSNQQDTVDSITNEMKEVIINAEKKPADYTEYNAAKDKADDIISTGNVDENGNAIYDASAFEQYKQAVESIDSSLPKDLTTEYQSNVNDATTTLENLTATLENNKLADYTEFNDAKDALQEIVDNPDAYTSESVEAAQKALDTVKDFPDNLVVGENNSNQTIVDNAAAAMNQVLGTIEKKADYTDFDKVVDDLQNIVNNPDQYTEESVQAAEEALKKAEEVSKDLPESAQPQLNEVTAQLKDVVDNAQKFADYTEYNAALDEANKLISTENVDENGNSVYNEDAFNAYKEAVEKIDSELVKDLTSDYQSTVDEATQTLIDLRTELDTTKGYEETVIDPETPVDEVVGEIINEITQNQGYTEDEIIVEFKNYLGEELPGEDFVGTGSTMRVILKSTGELLEYKLFIIMGDVNGDGIVNVDDYNKSIDITLDGEPYAEENKYFFTANDIDADGYIDVIDTVFIKRMCNK